MSDVQSSLEQTQIPLWQKHRRTAKIAPTFEQSDGGATHTFLFTNERQYTEQLSKHKPSQSKCMGHTANNAKIVLTFECSDGETIHTFHLHNFIGGREEHPQL